MRRIGRARTTLETYEAVITKHLAPSLGKIELRKLTAHDLESYYQARKKAGMADRTIRQHHSILSGALTQATKWGWLASSPSRSATPPKKPKGKKRIPAVEEVRLLIESANGDIDLATAVMIASVTGCRRGELCGLRWPDVNWNDGTMKVVRQRVPVRGGDVTIEHTKGEGQEPDPPGGARTARPGSAPAVSGNAPAAG
jgi:integrase